MQIRLFIHRTARLGTKQNEALAMAFFHILRRQRAHLLAGRKPAHAAPRPNKHIEMRRHHRAEQQLDRSWRPVQLPELPMPQIRAAQQRHLHSRRQLRRNVQVARRARLPLSTTSQPFQPQRAKHPVQD